MLHLFVSLRQPCGPSKKSRRRILRSSGALAMRTALHSACRGRVLPACLSRLLELGGALAERPGQPVLRMSRDTFAVTHQRHEILVRVDLVQLARVNQRHINVARQSPSGRSIIERVLPMEDRLLQRSVASMVIRGRPRNPNALHMPVLCSVFASSRSA